MKPGRSVPTAGLQQLASVVTGRAGGLRNLGSPEAWAVVVLSLAVGLYLVLYATVTPERSYTVSALSRGVAITFDAGRQSEWRLRAATLCVPLVKRTKLTDARDPSEVCDPRLFRLQAVGAIEMIWPDGAQVSLTRTREGAVRLRIAETSAAVTLPDGTMLPPGSLMIVARDDFLDSGTLPFFGCATIGSQVRGGSSSELLEGRFEVRETIFLRSTQIMVEVGELLPGDSVVFRHQSASDGPDASAEDGGAEGCFHIGGFVGSPAGEDADALRIVAYAGLSDPVLIVNRRGLAPKRIAPDWMDRAVKDPWLVGFATMLTVVTALNSIVLGVSSWFFTSRHRAAREGSPQGRDGHTPPGP